MEFLELYVFKSSLMQDFGITKKSQEPSLWERVKGGYYKLIVAAL
jgi:hypothetical protein